MGRKPSETLTANQFRVLDFIKSGQSPTLKEIAEYMGWASLSTAAEVVNSLIRLGLVKRNRKGRNLRATTTGKNYPEKGSQE